MKLSILIPVRTEGLDLKVMLRMLRALVAAEHEVLVIYDPPGDESVAVVQSLHEEYPELRLVPNEGGAGVLSHLRAGVAAARGDAVLIYAADEVGPLLAIDDMLALLDEGCDLVSCTRFAHGGRRLGGPRVGGFLSWAANRLFQRLVKNSLTDVTTGIKVFRRELFSQFALDSEPIGWLVAFEMSIKAQLRGLVLGEVPIASIDRLFGGDSSFELSSWTRAYLRWFLWGVWRLRSVERPPVRVRIPRWKGAET